MRRAGPLLAAVAAAILAACSGGSSGGRAASSSADRPAATTSTTTTSTTTTTTLAPCAAPPVSASAVRVTEGDADVDGDATPDHITVYGVGAADSPSAWHVHVALGAADRGAIDSELPAGTAGGIGDVRLLGAAAIGGQGRTIVVQAGNGASVALVALLAVDGCQLARLAPPGGGQELAIGGTVTHLDGLRCEDDRLVILTARSVDGSTYETTTQPFEREGAALVAASPPAAGTAASGDGSLAAFSGLACEGVEPL